MLNDFSVRKVRKSSICSETTFVEGGGSTSQGCSTAMLGVCSVRCIAQGLLGFVSEIPDGEVLEHAEGVELEGVEDGRGRG